MPMEAGFWPELFKVVSELLSDFKWAEEAWHLVLHPYHLVCSHGADHFFCDHDLFGYVLAVAAVVGLLAAASHRSSH